jgi:hypothetical protein
MGARGGQKGRDLEGSALPASGRCTIRSLAVSGIPDAWGRRSAIPAKAREAEKSRLGRAVPRGRHVRPAMAVAHLALALLVVVGRAGPRLGPGAGRIAARAGGPGARRIAGHTGAPGARVLCAELGGVLGGVLRSLLRGVLGAY